MLRELIAWDTLHGEPGAFVDPALADDHSDLLFSAQLRTDAAEVIHVLLEHQSTANPSMPLRTLSYRTRVWNRYLKARPDAWLPPILAVLVSHVPGGWTNSRTLDDMFAPSVRAIPGLSASIPPSDQTRRTGSPYTLVLAKTRVLFAREAAERKTWATDLAWLKKTAPAFGPSRGRSSTRA